MLKIAITGNIGSGKSTVAHFFKMLGVPIFSADVAGHQALLRPEVITALQSVFDDTVFDENGTPNRRKIGEIVFSDTDKLQQLNRIVHPIIKNEMAQWFEQQPSQISYALCEAAVLFEARFDPFFDKIITVSAPEALRIKRIEARDGIPRQTILQRMASQMDEKIKISKSDYCIVNDDIRSVIAQVLKIHDDLIKIPPEEKHRGYVSSESLWA
jgi:dephospho-CoA kinase